MKKVTQKDFEEIVIDRNRDIQFILHNLVSVIRKMNRDGKIEDYQFEFLHRDIDLIFAPKSIIKKDKLK